MAVFMALFGVPPPRRQIVSFTDANLFFIFVCCLSFIKRDFRFKWTALRAALSYEDPKSWFQEVPFYQTNILVSDESYFYISERAKRFDLVTICKANYYYYCEIQKTIRTPSRKGDGPIRINDLLANKTERDAKRRQINRTY